MNEAWVTKWALTRGVYRIVYERREPGSILIRDAAVRRLEYLVLGIDAFESVSEARADARQRRDRRVKALQMQLTRLSRLEFRA